MPAFAAYTFIYLTCSLHFPHSATYMGKSSVQSLPTAIIEFLYEESMLKLISLITTQDL